MAKTATAAAIAQREEGSGTVAAPTVILSVPKLPPSVLIVADVILLKLPLKTAVLKRKPLVSGTVSVATSLPFKNPVIVAIFPMPVSTPRSSWFKLKQVMGYG